NAPLAASDNDALPNSVAVLPFVNVGADPKNEYFSDGVTEEILDAVSRIPGIKVAARTSSFAFKGKSEDISEIARRLRVANILEGSVQRSGDQVRITAKLVKANDGFQVWSEHYTRPAADLFAVEDEISRSIATALRTTLAADAVLASGGTADVGAHQYYLLGLDSWSRRNKAAVHDAEAYFSKAIAADSTYALAHAGLALALSVLPNYDPDVAPAPTFDRGRAAANRALALDPNSAQAYAALSQIAQYQDSLASAARLAKRAIAINPNYATAHQWLAEVYWLEGRNAEALAQIKTALQLDPLSIVMNGLQCQVDLSAGDYIGATRVCKAIHARDPEFVSASSKLFQIALETHRYDDARAALRDLLGPDAFLADTIIGGFTTPAGRAAALRLIDNPAEANASEIATVAMVAELIGDRDRAIAIAQKAAQLGVAGWQFWSVMSSPGMKSLREDTRFPAIYRWPRGRTPNP
ncbi:MAG: tetratricopeptide repeat protein, partial [Longimicrobiales bacterium]